MGDAKRKPLKKRLHPKPLGSKSPSNPLIFKIYIYIYIKEKGEKRKKRTKPNPKKGLSCHCKGSLVMAGLVVAS
jgi:hypothetical protein